MSTLDINHGANGFTSSSENIIYGHGTARFRLGLLRRRSFSKIKPVYVEGEAPPGKDTHCIGSPYYSRSKWDRSRKHEMAIHQKLLKARSIKYSRRRASIGTGMRELLRVDVIK